MLFNSQDLQYRPKSIPNSESQRGPKLRKLLNELKIKHGLMFYF